MKNMRQVINYWWGNTHSFCPLIWDSTRWRTTSIASIKYSLIQFKNLTIITFDGSANILSINDPTKEFQSWTYNIKQQKNLKDDLHCIILPIKFFWQETQKCINEDIKQIVDWLSTKKIKTRTICAIQKYTQSPLYKAKIAYNSLYQHPIPI